MKTKNFPERVTKRRAEAYKRTNGEYPQGYQDKPTDITMRLGAAKRDKQAKKFTSLIAGKGFSPSKGKLDLNDYDVYPGFEPECS